MTSSTRPGSPTSWAARPSSGRWPAAATARAWGSCSTSCPTTWRPTRQPLLDRPELCAARFFDIDPETGAHRRFFDIDDLAGVRQEDPAVFEETHALVLALVREGVIDALRIDHPDGLADPGRYFARLRERGVEHGLDREDPRARRAAARLAGRRDRRLRVPQRRLRAVRRPAARARAHRAVGARSRATAPDFRRGRPRRPSSSRRGAVRARDRAAGPRCWVTGVADSGALATRGRLAADLPDLCRAVIRAGRRRGPRRHRRRRDARRDRRAAAARAPRPGRSS